MNNNAKFLEIINNSFLNELNILTFASPVSHVYNPLSHARKGYDTYLQKFAQCKKSEVSGRRLWGWTKEYFKTASLFFEDFIVLN